MRAIRRQEILNILRINGSVSIKEMAKQFEVSEMTIRRDLEWLYSKGFSRKVHGGAVVSDFLVPDITVGYSERKIENHQQKIGIAKSAIKLIDDGCTIYLDGGTTCGEIASFLPKSMHLKVVTDGLSIHSSICSNENYEVILLGGVLAKDKNTFDGIIPLEIAKTMRVDLAFFSAAAVDKESLMNINTIGLYVKKEMIKNSKLKVCVCDSSKIGRHAFYRVASWNDVDYFFTDSSIDNSFCTKLSENFKNLICEQV